MRPRVPTMEPVLDYVTERYGYHVTITEVAGSTGLSRSQAGNALLNLAKRGVVEKIANGVYVYRGAGAGKKDDGKKDIPLFEFIGHAGKSTILRDEQDNLWVARRLEVAE